MISCCFSMALDRLDNNQTSEYQYGEVEIHDICWAGGSNAYSSLDLRARRPGVAADSSGGARSRAIYVIVHASDSSNNRRSFVYGTDAWRCFAIRFNDGRNVRVTGARNATREDGLNRK